MENHVICADINDKPYIITANNLVIKANNSWCSFTYYTETEVINLTTEELLLKVLKVNSSLEKVFEANGSKSFYIFIKDNGAREVFIEVFEDIKSHHKIILFTEKENSRLGDKFIYLAHKVKQNMSSIAIYSYPDLTLLMASQKYMNLISDCSDDDVLGKNLTDIASKCSLATKFWLNRLKSKNDLVVNEVYINGKYWDVSFSSLFENDELKYFVTNIEECTERVLYRKKLEAQSSIIIKQNEELEAILDNMSDILLVVDKYGNYTKMNSGALKLDPEILVGILGRYSKNTQFFDADGNVMKNEDFPIYKILNGKSFTNQKISIKTEENEVVYDMNGTSVADTDGNIKFGVLCIHDVTDLDRQVKTIESHKKELELLIENINEAIIIIKKGRIYLQNKLARQLFWGRDLNFELLDYFEFYDMEHNMLGLEDLPNIRVLSGEIIENEKIILKYKLNPNMEKVISLNATPIISENNKISTCLMSIRDITEKEHKEELYREHRERLLRIETEKTQALEKVLRMKEEFLATISHEFKTPLTVINAILQTLDKFYSNEMSEKVKSYMKKIRQNTFRQLRLVNNLVDVTRVNTEQFKIHRMNLDIIFLTQSIVDSVRTFAQQKGVRIFFTAPEAFRIVGVDESIYERILLNLLSNAIKFTPQGKAIYIELDFKNANAIIKVTDEGIGIPPDKKEMIFERFGQVDSSLSRQAEGSGIGLSLVKTLVTALDGKIEVKSKVNKGSTFSVVIPAGLVTEEISQDLKMTDINMKLIQAVSIEFSDIYLS
jgi:Signal transduction histidine kinase